MDRAYQKLTDPGEVVELEIDQEIAAVLSIESENAFKTHHHRAEIAGLVTVATFYFCFFSHEIIDLPDCKSMTPFQKYSESSI